MNASKLFCTALLAGALAVVGCGSSDGGGSGSNGNGGGGAVCDFGTCATNEAFQAACLDIYQDCLDVGERTQSECQSLAETANCEG